MKINSTGCIGCGQCAEACKMDAIEFHKTHGYAVAKINQDLCIDCGLCKKICPGECIE
jgi:NAD-dependent dihydropyrimidine dehydrogenase PreA subunit